MRTSPAAVINAKMVFAQADSLIPIKLTIDKIIMRKTALIVIGKSIN